MIFKEESGDKETEPSYLCDAELDDETIGKALSSPLFIQERGESADRRQACHQVFFLHTQERGDPCTNLVRAEKNQVCSYAHHQVDEQPTKRTKKNDEKSAVAMLKKNDLHESILQPVVNRGKNHERPGQPFVKRD